MTYLPYTFKLEIKFVILLDILTRKKQELSVKSNHLSWRHYSATDAVSPYVRSGLL